MNKMTKKTAFTMAQEALNTIETEEARQAWDVIQKELDRLERVALKAKSGETKADKAKAEFRQTVLEFVADANAPVRATDVATALGVSTQKAAPALNRLVDEGALVKMAGEKRTVKFALADAE